MSRGLGKGYLLSLALGKGSILGKGSPACPHKKKEARCAHGPWKRTAQHAAGANSHVIAARNQSCGSGPIPHDHWLQLQAGQFLQKLSPGYALEKAANVEFRAAQHAAGANYVEVAHSHMIGQSCGSGPLPHNWLQLHAGLPMPWKRLHVPWKRLMN